MIGAAVALKPEVSQETLGELYRLALPRVYGYLSNRCASTSEAEDLTQDTFLAAIDSLQKGTAVANPTAWMLAIARHKWLDHVRKTIREERRLALIFWAARVSDDEQAAVWDSRVTRDETLEILRGMPVAQRAVLLLRYLDGYSLEETARLIGRSVHATESLLSRGRESFRRAAARRPK